ncbi:MAG: putative amidohydrolase YtcJ [Litorivivens sp.]|jgi:predicted amidohydrolase YtcJ
MIEVFTAKHIITMNDAWPSATAVAVRDGIILEVGSLESLAPWFKHDEHIINESFAEHILMPGLIDPHLHPMMAAVLLPMQFITALEWKFPWETVPATTSPADYRRKLEENHAALSEGEAFFSWGYHRNWHGEMGRPLLDEIFGDRPAVIWQRSFHEVYLNTAMMALLEMEEDKVRGKHQIDYDNGHFYENGLSYAIGKLNQFIMAPEWIGKGLERLKKLVQFGGHTTVGDMAVGLFDFTLEWESAINIIDQDSTPFRVLCVPHSARLSHDQGGPLQGLEFFKTLPERSTDKLRFTNKVKMFTDGAFFSQLAMLQAPGYIDGHLGEWLMVPEEFEKVARLYWNEGAQIHVHCTGDLGLELALDTLEKLQWERPRFNHSFTIEHFGFSTPEQVHRIKALGANVSANVYYLHELSASYSDLGVGVERSEQMARVGSCEQAGILTALHSDFPMAPALPLHSAWVAVTRENCEGKIVAPELCMSLDAALRAITIDAARILGLENETGSIRSGKKADFAVLDQDPFEIGPARLKEIDVLATVFEGKVFWNTP